MSENRIQAAFLGLLERTAPTPREIQTLARRAQDPHYWMGLQPGRRLPPRHNAIPPAVFERAIEQMASDGYFHVDSVFSPTAMRRMRATIDQVRKAGWPSVFAMVYEEFWTILRTPPVTRLLEGMLGSQFRMIPHMWCHYVAPTPGAHGWSPHVDGTDKTRASLWLPFTDATLSNGCIYLVPDSRLPEGAAREFLKKRRYSSPEISRWLQGMQALPAPAGSVLGWNFGIVHWGSVASEDRHPRISAAYEFIAAGAAPHPEEQPLFDIRKGIPSFDQRLQMIVRALKSYRKFEPQIDRFYKVAEELEQASWPD